MNTRSECIEIVRKLAIKLNSNISFKEEDGFSYLATIRNGIITCPVYQEALLILYELDDKEKIFDYLFSLYMIDNDEYELCNELLSELEEKGLPVCADSDALYTSIFIKQLFLILHEYGHYLFATRDDIKKRFYEGMNRIGNEMFEDFSLDDSDIDMVINKIAKINKTHSYDSLYRNLFLNTNYKEKNQVFLSKSHNIEESAADLFAIFHLNDYLENYKIKTNVETGKCVFEAASFVGGLTHSQKILQLIGETDDEEYHRKIFDPQSKININLSRFIMLLIIIENYFGFDQSDNLDLTLNYFMMPFIGYSIDEEKNEKYVDAWVKGNDNMINLEIREKLHKRIMDYSNSLLSLYGQN